jgi:hypothetical protein
MPVNSFKAYYQIGTNPCYGFCSGYYYLIGYLYAQLHYPCRLTVPAMDSVLIWVELDQDEYALNDTAEAWVLTGVISPVDTFPYANSFYY